MLDAIEKGFPQREIADSAYAQARVLEEHERETIGVTAFADPNEVLRIPLLEIGADQERRHLDRLLRVRAERDADAPVRASPADRAPVPEVRIVSEGVDRARSRPQRRERRRLRLRRGAAVARLPGGQARLREGVPSLLGRIRETPQRPEVFVQARPESRACGPHRRAGARSRPARLRPRLHGGGFSQCAGGRRRRHRPLPRHGIREGARAKRRSGYPRRTRRRRRTAV